MRMPDKSEKRPKRARKSKRVPEARESQRGELNCPESGPLKNLLANLRIVLN